MDAQSLALFVDIVEAGNLSLAARHMKMSRANVSYHLAQLQKSIGLQLLRSTGERFATKSWRRANRWPCWARACTARSA
jgi:DNA-binding transcriptional LysR family regulator